MASRGTPWISIKFTWNNDITRLPWFLNTFAQCSWLYLLEHISPIDSVNVRKVSKYKISVILWQYAREMNSINMYFSINRARQTRDLGHCFDCDWSSCHCTPCDSGCYDSKYYEFLVSLSFNMVRSNVEDTWNIDIVFMALDNINQNNVERATVSPCNICRFGNCSYLKRF